MSDDTSKRLAFFASSLRCGGAEKVAVNLLRGADELGIPTDLLLGKAEGPFLADVPAATRIFDLRAAKLQHAIPTIARYVRKERPHSVISQVTQANVVLLLARQLARVKTRIAVVEASNLTACLESGMVRPRIKLLAKWLYPRADQILAASVGAARDVERNLGLATNRVRAIYNPIVDSGFIARSEAPAPHCWLSGGCDLVLVAVGRLGPEKDHQTLLRAMAILHKTRPVKLVIFGEGSERGRLEALRRELGLESVVDMPGITDNPAAAMRRASLFVLSSRFEGFGNVVAEALASGCPVVSTDCPSGPAEILDGGRFGVLVPPGQPEALARGIAEGLDRNWDRHALERRGGEFSVARSLAQYLEAIDYPLPAGALAAAA